MGLLWLAFSRKAGIAVDINKKAPAIAREEILIDASTEEVWEIHSNIDGWSDWNADIAESKLEGTLSMGAIFNWKSKRMNLTSTIQDLEPGVRIGWTGSSIGARARHIWILEQNGKGTHVTTEESLDGWLVSLLRGKMRKTLETSLNAWLIDLKNEVEMSSNGN